jgi:hypothetical protein
MTKSQALMKIGKIQQQILHIRCEKVIIDSDLAEAYGVTTKTLNQAIRRNADRFPLDFMFRLTKKEKQEVVTNCDHLRVRTPMRSEKLIMCIFKRIDVVYYSGSFT